MRLTSLELRIKSARFSQVFIKCHTHCLFNPHGFAASNLCHLLHIWKVEFAIFRLIHRREDKKAIFPVVYARPDEHFFVMPEMPCRVDPAVIESRDGVGIDSWW